MCGIVGVIGKANATEVLIQGLEKLEYRGYDSAGIFVMTEKVASGHLVKTAGRIKDLQAKVTTAVTGNRGIGHTRWATHGKPSEANAHPHQAQAGRYMLVHNGVIENYQTLKEQYLSGVTLEGETDTEIVVQLLAQVEAAENLTTEAAFKKVLQLIRGSYAFALIDQENPEVIYVAKNKSPLLIGLGADFNVICSDAMAMLTETKTFLEINDGEMVLVKADTVEIKDAAGCLVQRAPFTAEIDLSDIEKGTYDYYMLKEIDEQPAVLRRIMQKYQGQQTDWQIDEALLADLATCQRIYIVGCGTSWHAGWVGKKMLETCCQKPVEVHLSSELGYEFPVIAEKPFFLFLSQSGETADSRQVLVEVKRRGYPSLAMTNVAGSTLSREAKHTLLLHAGPEIAVASTKAYTAQIAVLSILAAALGQKLNCQSVVDLPRELSLTASVMESLVSRKQEIAELTNQALCNTRNAFYLGRGLDYYVAMEAALKLKEISYIQAEGFAAGELKHGTIALIEEGTPVFALISQANIAAHTRGNLMETKSRGGATYTFVTSDLAEPQDTFVIPCVHPLLSALTLAIPIQLVAYYACLSRGFDVDKPRNLAKSVTVE